MNLTDSSVLTTTHFAPTEVAPDTFVIHDHAGEHQSPMIVPVNALVIRGAEPVVVDTGKPDNEEQFLADVFSLVEPDDVHWVFITHDDIDHTGNLDALLAACPNATVVVNWYLAERMGPTLGAPPSRQRWVGDGESFDVGDRTLHAVRPPVYDSPTTRGLFDPTTGVYWASDAFGTPIPPPAPVRHVADLDPTFWDEGVATFSQYLAPWITLVDDRRYQASIDRIAALAPSVLVACHSPIVERRQVDRALDTVRRAPCATVAPQPGQDVLESIQQATALC